MEAEKENKRRLRFHSWKLETENKLVQHPQNIHIELYQEVTVEIFSLLCLLFEQFAGKQRLQSAAAFCNLCKKSAMWNVQFEFKVETFIHAESTEAIVQHLYLKFALSNSYSIYFLYIYIKRMLLILFPQLPTSPFVTDCALSDLLGCFSRSLAKQQPAIQKDFAIQHLWRQAGGAGRPKRYFPPKVPLCCPALSERRTMTVYDSLASLILIIIRFSSGLE